ncbi:MAG: DNA-processing protein DprA, partial [Candidatus Eremiobacterota bacterium]
MRRERAAWLALSLIPGLSHRQVFPLVGHHRSAWDAFRRHGDRSDPLRKLQEAESHDLRVVAPCDPEYPATLLQLTDPPAVLYLRGRTLPTGRAVAVVGSRQATRPGLAVARRLGWQLSEVGVAVVSGLARGIDGAAHQGCLESPAGQPVGILGCGLDRVYPAEHRRLYAQVASRGTLVSEYWPDLPPEPWRFPARNRLVAAISEAVVVVEAGERSGALITVEMALSLGREVMAVPGAVCDPTSRGTLSLLKDGAVLVRDGRDVTRELGLPDPPEPGRPVVSPEDAALIDLLGVRGSRPDELAIRLGQPVQEVIRRLGALQVAGHVRRLDTGAYVPRHWR